LKHLQLRCGVLLGHAEYADNAEFSCDLVTLFSAVLILGYPCARLSHPVDKIHRWWPEGHWEMGMQGLLELLNVKERNLSEIFVLGKRTI
jgi:hypothetical protein